MLGHSADVAQLARASPCHGEGRGFEPLHPLFPAQVPELAEPDRDDVPNLDRVERLADASHWVHHDEAERVNQLLIDFFAPAA
jgi:pimeloyl-ACP methyl ester carboxylesterase